MNDELKSILLNLPEGIILINNESEEVALTNFEFGRLFHLPKVVLESQKMSDFIN
jgi:hypothetical protein